MFVAYETNGKIHYFSQTPTFPTRDLITNAEISVLEVDAGPLDPNAYYVRGGSLVLLPTKPNEYCEFDYVAEQWFDLRTNDTQWTAVRADRNQRLQATDWTQLADIPAETKLLWEPYRQELRDVTNQPDPFSIVWPTPPQ
jgi:hypothetical protein